MVLARLMQQLRHELSVSLYIAHFNHHLRRSSNRDQKFVQRLGLELNIPVIVGERREKGSKVSEDQARRLRLGFFSGVMRHLKADALALAHTENDTAETVLMRLLRGSGLCGLRGILAERHIDGLRIIRPLLEVSRPQIEGYLKRNNLRFCVDETNRSTQFLRNKIRLKLLPQLAKEYNPKISAVLNDLAASAGDDYDFLQQVLAQRIKENVVSSKTTVRMGLAFLQRQHPALRRLLMRHAFERLTGDFKQLEFKHIAQAQELLQKPAGSITHWPRAIVVKRQKKCLEFHLCGVQL